MDPPAFGSSVRPSLLSGRLVRLSTGYAHSGIQAFEEAAQTHEGAAVTSA